MIDYGVEKEMLLIPLFCRGMASVVISIVFLTSILQGGLHFFVFPQALTINGFTGAVTGATLGPALIGELFRHVMAKNSALLSAGITDATAMAPGFGLRELQGIVQAQAIVVSMKEIYGWLLLGSLVILFAIIVSYGKLRPSAIFPKWRTIRRAIRRVVRSQAKIQDG